MADFLQEKPTSRTKQRPVTGRHRQLHGIPAIVVFPAPVAQLDRALASEAKGRAFESHRARHLFSIGDHTSRGWQRTQTDGKSDSAIDRSGRGGWKD